MMAFTDTRTTDVTSVPSIPKTATTFGFRVGARGTHTSRTMMFAELEVLLDAVPAGAEHDDYVRAIRDDNVLAKRTVATREHTSQRLSELYALDPRVTVFRILRRMWEGESERGRPLLALLCALTRDPLLRTTACPVLDLDPGEEFPRPVLASVIREAVGTRMKESTVEKVVRNVASTWTQAGHLEGRVFKRRKHVVPTPLSMAYALALGFVLGQRGTRLLKTFWTRTLDASEETALSLALEAKRLGVIDVKHAGEVTEVNFPTGLFTREELEMSHGPH